jgi:hypothetical protein
VRRRGPSVDVSEVRREEVTDVAVDSGIVDEISVRFPNESVERLLLAVGGGGFPWKLEASDGIGDSGDSAPLIDENDLAPGLIGLVADAL